MSSSAEDSPGFIKLADRIPELEEEVLHEVRRVLSLPQPEKRVKKYSPVEIPKFGRDLVAKRDWEMEEIRRCLEGYDGLPGVYYNMLNHCYIKDKKKGKIRPEFRVADLEWWKFRNKVQATSGRGIVCIKRRQVGMSWKEAINMLYKSTFNLDYIIGFNSKTLEDSYNLFNKVKYVHRNVNDFLRPIATKTDRRDRMEFSKVVKDQFGNRTVHGTGSEIICVAPTPTGHAGNQYAELIIDECFSPDFKVLMHDGSVKEIKDIKIGDMVMGVDSGPREVLSLTSGEDEMYEITGRRGVSFRCNSKHKLALFHSHSGYTEMTPAEYLLLPPEKQRYYQLQHAGVEYKKQDYFFDPYWFGLWLGDGFSANAGICTVDDEILDYLTKEFPQAHGIEYSVSEQKHSKNKIIKNVRYKSDTIRLEVLEKTGEVHRFRNKKDLRNYYKISQHAYERFVEWRNYERKPYSNSGCNSLIKNIKSISDVYLNPSVELSKLGVRGNKHIPQCYLKTCRDDRLKLLAGLIDSDGHKGIRDVYEITFANKRLAEDTLELIHSLGFTGTIKTKQVHRQRKDGTYLDNIHYRIHFSGNDLHEIPCRLPRKQTANNLKKRKGRRDPLKTGLQVRPIGRGQYVGFRLKYNPLFIGADYLIHHNCGEQEQLSALWSNAEDCIMLNSERSGLPVLFGTMGETDKAGRDLMEFWLKHKIYDLEQFAFWGYNCMIMDEFGNDNIEDSIRWIIYTRKKKEEGSRKVYNKFIQKYPLHENDALLNTEGCGVGNPIKIGEQKLWLAKNPPETRVGWMRKKSEGGQDFVPDTLKGQIIIYELPDPNRKNGYYLICDPAEDDDVKKTRDSSDIASAILARPYGLEPPKLVAEYCDRPAKLEDYYEQLALLLYWYNMQFLIEMNKGGWRMDKYFELYHPRLLALAPRSAQSARHGVEMRRGVKMTADKKLQMMGLIEEYVDNYVKFIPSIRLLDQFGKFGSLHEDDDLAVSFGWGLIGCQADKRAVQNINAEESKNPKVIYKKQNGIPVLTTRTAQSTPLKKKSAIFR